jgi:Cu2+-exporting ATPase
VSYISVDNQVLGYVTITDAIKSTSVAAIKELMNQGIEVIMLTGDNENTAKAVADELHLTSFIAGCLPEDKLKEIKDYKTKVKLWPWQETELMMLRHWLKPISVLRWEPEPM